MLWQKIYGGGEDDYAEAVQQTRDGGYIMAGWTYSFGAGGRNIWMLKLDGQGDIDGPELFETRQAFADDYLLLTVPSRAMTGELRKITFSVDRQKRLNMYVSGPPGCHYSFPEPFTRKINQSLIQALEQFEYYKNAAEPITKELGRFTDNNRTLRIAYRKDLFGTGNISLSLMHENTFKAGQNQSLIVAPDETVAAVVCGSVLRKCSGSLVRLMLNIFSSRAGGRSGRHGICAYMCCIRWGFTRAGK